MQKIFIQNLHCFQIPLIVLINWFWMDADNFIFSIERKLDKQNLCKFVPKTFHRNDYSSCAIIKLQTSGKSYLFWCKSSFIISFICQNIEIWKESFTEYEWSFFLQYTMTWNIEIEIKKELKNVKLQWYLLVNHD